MSSEISNGPPFPTIDWCQNDCPGYYLPTLEELLQNHFPLTSPGDFLPQVVGGEIPPNELAEEVVAQVMESKQATAIPIPASTTLFITPHISALANGVTLSLLPPYLVYQSDCDLCVVHLDRNEEILRLSILNPDADKDYRSCVKLNSKYLIYQAININSLTIVDLERFKYYNFVSTCPIYVNQIKIVDDVLYVDKDGLLSTYSGLKLT